MEGALILKLALAFMMQDSLPWIGLHLPLFRASGVFDGVVALDGGSTDESVFYVESLGGSVYHRKFDWKFGEQAQCLVNLCEAEGYDAMLRIDPDECMFSEDMRKVRTTLEHFPDKLIGLSRRHFIGDRLHVHRDWNYDPQWRAWALHRGVHYPEGQRVHEVPSWKDGEQMLLSDVYLFHYGYLEPAPQRAYKIAMYDAIQHGKPLPTKAEYANWPPLDIPSVPFDGRQPLDPNVVGIHAPFESILS